MNVQINNQPFSLNSPDSFNPNWVLGTRAAGTPEGSDIETAPVVITRLHQKEVETMKTSFRNQVRNVVALEQFIRKRLTAEAGSGLGGAEPALIGINWGEELSFRLPGSDEAFYIFTATLQRKSYFLHHWSQAEPNTKVLKVKLKMADMVALEQELSIILENIKPADYVATLLNQKYRNTQGQKLAG